MTAQTSTIVALDIGAARIGVAISIPGVSIAKPLLTLENNESFPTKLHELLEREHAAQLIVGLPRSMQGDDTQQTAYVRDYMTALDLQGISVHYKDEAVTSVKAEAELKARNKPYEKADIDSLAACYILQDYLDSTQKES